MKYIVSQLGTQQLLKQWAGDHELIIATHFFWNAGSPLQKSRIGLLRTLLYHVIHESPELGPRLFPECFSASGSSVAATNFSLSELFRAIRDLGSTTAPDVRLCFFIDGLDEFVGEHIDLVELVSDLAKCPYIKICVSSRPWNVFERAYHGLVDGELAVQNFTSEDVRSYVEITLLQNNMFVDLRSSNLEECDRLVGSIVHKAQGVFLWVVLVVQSLIRGLTNDDDLTILHARVDSYPASLSAYFRRMFDRIEGVYLAQSARLLLVASAAEQSLPFWSPTCLEVEAKDIKYALTLCKPPSLRDARFAFGCTCPLPRVQLSFDGSQNSALSMVTHSCFYFFGSGARLLPHHPQKLRRYLDARCGDLLELGPDGIAFIHRTARDFIFEGGLTEKLEALAGPNFDLGISLTNIAVAGAKRESDPAISALKTFFETEAKTFRPSKEHLLDGRSDMDEFQALSILTTRLRSNKRLVKPENMGLYEELRLVGRDPSKDVVDLNSDDEAVLIAP
ncbi:hypothetical protein BBD39_06055 [Arsenophonus endosymbiont of Bemisia tabaci Asia II 3]|nr:hypothetical protein BBD39_06055 [Arsenophonus endosymbiont of Bemisia tabaci Asia II 3]